MSVLYFLIPTASLLALCFLFLFLWANKSNQYEDLDTPAQRMLLDDEIMNINNINIKNKEKKNE